MFKKTLLWETSIFFFLDKLTFSLLKAMKRKSDQLVKAS